MEAAEEGQNEQAPSAADLVSLIEGIKGEVLAAESMVPAHLADMARPLSRVAAVLRNHKLDVSDKLGDAGFNQDKARSELVFSTDALRRMWSVVDQLPLAANATQEELAALRRRSIALYVLHETYHIVQNLAEYELAQTLKQAYGADELSKFDLVADVVAANCLTILQAVERGDYDPVNYVKAFAANVLLAYELLCHGFNTTGVDHKKKRALGLLTCATLARRAVEANEREQFLKLMPLATAGAFTSVDIEQGAIVALTLKPNPGWSVLFRAKTSPQVAAQLWKAVDLAQADVALGVLWAAFGNAPLPEHD